MRRARTLLQLPIVSLADGERIGQVRDVVFDCEGNRIAALVVEEASWVKETKVVPLDRVRSLGRDAVTVYDRQSIVPASADKNIRRLVYNGVLLNGLHVLTEGGADLGTIQEVFVAPDGKMVGYEISAGVVRDALDGQRFVPASETIRAGVDCCIVPDHVEEMILHQPSDVIEQLEASPPIIESPRESEPTEVLASPPDEEATRVIVSSSSDDSDERAAAA